MQNRLSVDEVLMARQATKVDRPGKNSTHSGARNLTQLSTSQKRLQSAKSSPQASSQEFTVAKRCGSGKKANKNRRFLRCTYNSQKDQNLAETYLQQLPEIKLVTSPTKKPRTQVASTLDEIPVAKLYKRQRSSKYFLVLTRFND